MKEIECPRCEGRGGYSGLLCNNCSGLRTVWVKEDPEPLPPIYSPPKNPPKPRTKEEMEKTAREAVAEIEELLANGIAVIAGPYVIYLGMTNLDYEWYWPVGAGLLTAIIVKKALLGPFHFCLVIIKWVIGIALLAGFIFIAVKVISVAVKIIALINQH